MLETIGLKDSSVDVRDQIIAVNCGSTPFQCECKQPVVFSARVTKQRKDRSMGVSNHIRQLFRQDKRYSGEEKE